VTRKLVVEADGGSRGNPGPAGYGALVADAGSGEVLAELHDSLGTTTNNAAEYSGLIAGLRAAADISPGADVDVRMDSKLVVEQMSGRWQIKDPNLRTLAEAAREAAGRLGSVTYSWIPRARNARADRLANKAMDAAGGPAAAGRRGATGSAAAGTPAQANASSDEPGAQDTAAAWGPAQGQKTTTLLLRHGETPLSAERKFAGRGDIPLTETGKRQAAAAGQAAERRRHRHLPAAAGPAHRRGGRGSHRRAAGSEPRPDRDGLRQMGGHVLRRGGRAVAGGDVGVAG